MDSLLRKVDIEHFRENLHSIVNNKHFLPILAGLGAFYTLKQICGLSSFFYTHNLRPSSLQRYNSASDGKSPASWALVTGASDGIGKGFSEELCNRGFNVILHGRNETKLKAVRQELLKQWPKIEIKILIFDVVNDTCNTARLEAAAAELNGLDLRVLVNNVGGGAGIRPVYVPLHERDAAMTNLFIDLNLRFPTQITRLLLPQLIQHAPACILNIGSLASESVAPYACIYSGSKAYNKSWSASLDAELKAEGHDIEVKLIQFEDVREA
jgi:17beta-estradiol 17-dehydrogenase / very-long-chain 3-oxoacyl-CoA reductase